MRSGMTDELDSWILCIGVGLDAGSRLTQIFPPGVCTLLTFGPWMSTIVIVPVHVRASRRDSKLSIKNQTAPVF